jgi:shikimate dehydrogenase
MIQLGLVGWPVAHSLSPRLHKAALVASNLQGDYKLFQVKPDKPDELSMILNLMRAGKLVGLNVTIPYKRVIYGLVDKLTSSAAMIGAVNTVFLRDGSLVGENTDAAGFLADLQRQSGIPIRNHKCALVLGAGGSARAVISALLEKSTRVIVAARKIAQVDDIVADFRQKGRKLIQSTVLGYETLEPIVDQVNLIVNTTPVGMYPGIDDTPWPKGLPFPQKAFFYDLIYNPTETRMVRDARANGLFATNGLGMLVEQAALSFEIWTGISISREVMYSAIQNNGA